MPLLEAAFRTLPGFMVVVMFVGVLWHLLDKLTPFDDSDELFVKQNYAYLIQRLGLCAALVVAMLAVVPDFDTAHPWWSSFWLAAEGTYVLAMILLSKAVVDVVIFPKIKNVTLLLEGNMAIGTVEACFYIGLGFILKGSLTGTASSNWLSFASSVVFFALGLAFVVGVFWFHELVTPYNLRDRLKDGNMTAALELGGLLVAISAVVAVGVAGDFTGWWEGVKAFTATATVSVVLLYLLRWAIDKAILTRTTIKEIQDKNQTAAAGLLGGFMVLMGFVVASAVSNVM